jgi:head-tail adaptor
MSFFDLLTQTATIQEQHTSNVGGVVQKTWTDKLTTPARLVANSGSMRKGAEDLEKYTRGDYTLFLSFQPDITEKMRVTVDGDHYEIAFVAKVMGKQNYDHLELQLNKVTA